MKGVYLASTLAFLILFPVLTPGIPVPATTQELSYDDGDVDFGWATGPVGGAAVLFTPPSTPWLLTKIKAAAWYQYGVADFYIEIWDSSRNELLRVTYRYDDFFKDYTTWATIDIPDVEVTGDFYVCVFPNDVGEEHFLWIGGDNDPPCTEHSYDVVYTTNKIDGQHTASSDCPWDWCIHAIGQLVEAPSPPPARPLTSKWLREPVILDGSIDTTEWMDANLYEDIGTDNIFDIYLKHDDLYFYIGIKVADSGWGEDDWLYLYFDEGDDGAYGSGSRDGILVGGQEDYKAIGDEGQLFDGCYITNFWGYDVSNPPDFRAKNIYHEDHWEYEIRIPFSSDEDPESNLNIDIKDVVCGRVQIGIMFSYVDYLRKIEFNCPEDAIKDDASTYLVLEFEAASTFPYLIIYEPKIDGSTVSIDGVAIPYSGAEISNIYWDWGDGSSEDSWFPTSHTYSQSGTYMITITAYQSDGQTTAKSITVEVARTDYTPLYVILGLASIIGAILAFKMKKPKPPPEIEPRPEPKKIEVEIRQIQKEILRLRKESKSREEYLEELKARSLIGQISDEEYESEKGAIEKEIQAIEEDIASKREKEKKFKECLS